MIVSFAIYGSQMYLIAASLRPCAVKVPFFRACIQSWPICTPLIVIEYNCCTCWCYNEKN